MNTMTACLIICVLTLASFIWRKFSLGTTAMISVVLFSLAGCIDADSVVKAFGNTTGIMILSMFVVAAGFSKTQFVHNLASAVMKLSKGNLTIVMAGYIGIAILLGQFIASNLIPFAILYPLLTATVEEMGYSPSKAIFPLGLICIIGTGVLPLGSGATVYAELNGYLAANGSNAVMGVLDPMKARLPLLIIMGLYCIFLAPRFAPDKPVVAIQSYDIAAADKTVKKAQMKPFQEKCGYIVFFGVSLAFIFASQLHLATWIIALIGALLMVVTGVLSPKEATDALPVWVYLVYVGGLIMAGSLSATGAGALIGNAFAGLAGGAHNSFVLYFMFFIGPYILTQFILNRSAMLIFYPFVIQACLSLGCNPIGPVICVQAACLSSFLTPMATGTVPYMMGAGGYDQRSMLKQSVIPSVLCIAVTVIWFSLAFPLF